ncbi:histidine kinase [Brevundimonas sp. S30B]|uniref:sensor histidine kinase n=1 Tax=unclassified Brevundimonas TaxID=2622653 RepID=UPI0010721045|nr:MULTISPECIES: sensor histidine kinase [unclassified Brevundimonas]QBX38476.1 histidine kinase [Brevundimonas sp. MF30-B]TFW02185.1 histidine kinase [Brevundimonas sp. S30B]
MPVSRALDLPPPPPSTAARQRAPGRVGAAPAQGALGLGHPAVLLFTAVGVVMLVVLSLQFSRSVGVVAALWGASGLAIGVWLRSRRSMAFDVAFGALMAAGFLIGNLLAGNEFSLALMFTFANMLDVVVAVGLARRFAPSLTLGSVEDTGRFLLTAAVAAPLPAAAFAGLMLSFMHGSPFWPTFQTWWFGHALSVAVVGSCVLSLRRRALVRLRSPARLAETTLLFGLLFAACGAVFTTFDLPLGFTILPIILLIAVRARMVGVTTALVVVAIFAVGGSMAGHGPYARFDGPGRALMAQLLVLLGYMPIVLVAALLEERDRLSDRAKAGQVRAERSSAAKSRLLANVAHEIKSPVGGVIGIGDLWRTGQLGPTTPTQVEMAEMLVRTARQVETLAHDLLDVARAEAGGVKVELRPVKVEGLLQDVRRVAQLRPEAEGVRVEVSVDDPDLVALADSQRLNQVIGNLTSNALKYGGSGGVVRLMASASGEHIRLAVVDRGPGLSPEKQAQLFEPFNRLGLEKSAIEGHGVGLALAKRLTELQGGEIGVLSAPGEGATFWVLLPRA